MNACPDAIAFDIIETLFGLEPLRSHFEQAGLPAHSLELWFATGLRDTFALAATGSYAPFRAVLEGALDEVGAGLDNRIEGDARERLFEAMGTLPPHADVVPGLRQLYDAGIKLIALSNGSAKVTTQLLANAGFDSVFHQIVSIDEVGLAKPRKEVYYHAASIAGVSPGNLMLVASHPWDVHGALTAGLMAAYLHRGKPFPPFMRAPSITETSLTQLAEQLLRN